MVSEDETDMQATTFSEKPTMRVFAITANEDADQDGARRDDPRFVRPDARSPVKEGSGTYSVVYKKTE